MLFMFNSLEFFKSGVRSIYKWGWVGERSLVGESKPIQISESEKYKKEKKNEVLLLDGKSKVLVHDIPVSIFLLKTLSAPNDM